MRCAASARVTASSSARPAPTTRSTNRSAPGGAIPAWSTGCRFITSGWKPCSTICRGPGSRSITRRRRCAATGSRRSADSYAARHNVTPAARAGAPIYRPIRPDQLYLDRREWQAALHGRPVVQLSPFAADQSDGDAFDAGARPARSFAAERADPNIVLFEAVRDYLEAERKSGRKTAVAAFSPGSADRLLTVLRERGVSDLRRIADGRELEELPGSAVGLAVLPVEQGFATDDLVLLGEQDILGDRLARTSRRRRSLDQFITEATALTPGDLVVHDDHGIGRYEALETIDVAGAPHDCVRVLYAGDDKLFVPVENIEVLVALRLGRCRRAARPARRGRLAVAQGAGQEAHPRHRRRIDPRRRRAPAAAGRRVAAARGDLRGIRRPLPLSRDRGPAERDRRHVRRHGLGQADGPADLRRCRVWQDRGRVARRLHRGDGRVAGRDRGADDPAVAAALPQLHRALCRAAAADCAAVAAGPRQSGARGQEGARRRTARYRDRHPRVARQGRPVRPSGPPDRRRGAAFRRRAEGKAEAIEGRCACPDADRDADPAHPAIGACRGCAR